MLPALDSDEGLQPDSQEEQIVEQNKYERNRLEYILVILAGRLHRLRVRQEQDTAKNSEDGHHIGMVFY